MRCPHSFAVHGLQALIRGYQLFISPWIGPRCRFLPTCSDYALDALARHGAIRGGWLTVRRLVRCHPFGGSGFDPVPENDVASRRGQVCCGQSSPVSAHGSSSMVEKFGGPR